MFRFRPIFSFLLVLVLLTGCSSGLGPRASTPTVATATAAATAVAAATASGRPALEAPPTSLPTASLTPYPTATASPAPTATSTPVLVSLNATVWTRDPAVPVLVYHRFLPSKATNESSTKMMLKTFEDEMQMLDEAGFSLVPLAAWLKGDLRIAAGRRPLILTMDDLFFADQIFLEPDGTPSLRSGLGVLWKFSQEHPRFGFSAALFYNLGDKLYGNKQVGDWFNAGNGWQESLAQAIAWCIEHGAMPYNHFYTHPRLVLMEPPDILQQLKRNEVQMQKLLAGIGKEDLAAKPDNMIALTYSVWPDSRGSRKAIMTYPSIHGALPLGVLEADPHYDTRYIMKAPYVDDFTPWHIPRLGGQMPVIQSLVKEIDRFPAAQECTLQVGAEKSNDSQALSAAITESVSTGRCPAGVYALQGLLFRADGRSVTALALQHPEPR